MSKNLLALGFISLFFFASANNLSAAPTSLSGGLQDSLTSKDLIGRWNITMDENGKAAPSWLEVKLSGNRTLVGSFVGVNGSARPVAEVRFDKGNFSFAIPPQWDSGNLDLVLAGELSDGGIRGTIVTSNGKSHTFKGQKAPALKRTAAPEWAKPIELFNGKDLKGWHASGDNQWLVKDGILTSPRSGANLISDQKFSDFKLHAEFRYPKGSNSGLYLRGRYEAQIEDAAKDAHPSSVLFSGIYGFIAPSEIAALGPDQWQTFDITLLGRMVTVVVNGKTVISNQEIPGITGGALDSHEGEPGPLYIQGDHGPVEFRKIVITPVKSSI